MFKDRPPWVARKLEWNPLQPRTPPPRSVKFLGLSWKNDWRTNRHPLYNNMRERKRWNKKNQPKIHEVSDILFCRNLPQDNVQDSQGLLRILCFLTSQSHSNGFNWNFGSKTNINFHCFGLGWTPHPLGVTPIWTTTSTILRSPKTRSPHECQRKSLTLSHNIQRSSKITSPLWHDSIEYNCKVHIVARESTDCE